MPGYSKETLTKIAMIAIHQAALDAFTRGLIIKEIELYDMMPLEIL
jgi:hypothetical protein